MSGPLNVIIEVDASSQTEPFKPIWNWFGYDEPNYTYTEHGKKLLSELSELGSEPARVRTHNLLTSGDGTAALKWGSTNAYTEDENGNPVYDWTIMDRIFDAYIEAGVVPFVQIGFMPEALSDYDGPYQHSWRPQDQTVSITSGWTAPPNDLAKWTGLITAWAKHMAERYGHDRVSSWPWEVWNEPDGLYWTGTIPEFCAMYDATVGALKAVLPEVRVGGPHTCGAFDNEKAQTFLRGFLDHCDRNQSPIDFIAFHAKGNPVTYKDHVRMGIRKHLKDIEANLEIMGDYSAFRGLTAILGESDPEGCAACSARYHPRNGYRNGPLYGVYVIETIMRTYELSRKAGIEIEGAVTWAFMFDGQPYFDGFRDLATNGIDKAVLNAFRLMGKLGGSWIETTSSHALPLQSLLDDGVRNAPDINAVATRDANGVSILVWHYHDDDIAGEDAEITIQIGGLASGELSVSHYRMDAGHSNAFGVWQKMGSPQQPDPQQYAELEAAGKLARLEDRTVRAVDGRAELGLSLPRQGASLLRLDF